MESASIRSAVVLCPAPRDPGVRMPSSRPAFLGGAGHKTTALRGTCICARLCRLLGLLLRRCEPGDRLGAPVSLVEPKESSVELDLLIGHDGAGLNEAAALTGGHQ